MAAAMVAVVPAKELAVVFTAQHTRETVRCDATQYPFGQWAAQHATARATARVPSSATTAAEELAQQTRLLLVRQARRLGQVVGVLQPVVYAILVEVDEVVALPLCLLAQVPPELHPLLGRHAGEGLLGRLQVIVRGELRGHLAVAVRRLLLRDSLRALLVAVDEVFDVPLHFVGRGIAGVHASSLLSCFLVSLPYTRRSPRGFRTPEA